MKKFIKYAKRKTSSTSINFDRGSLTSFGSRTSVSIPSEPGSDFGSVQSLGCYSSGPTVYQIDLKTKDKSFTKLHRAAWLGDLEKVKKQVKKDDVNAADSYKRTPLHLACAHGNKEVVWFLLGCKGNLTLHDNEGFSPFLRAVQAHHTGLVHFLIERNVDSNDATENEDTALHLSAKLNACDVAEIVLQKGANIDSVNKDGSSPLHIATQNCNVDMAELLLRHGANVNSIDNDDRSCLMLACRLGSPQLVSLFLEFGANRDIKDKSGLTAAEYGAISQQNECLRLLGQEIEEEQFAQPIEEETVDWKKNDDEDLMSPHSWNDESDKELQKILFPNLNLNKFLASLDDSDKDVSEIDPTQIKREESVRSSTDAPPKPPRISSVNSEPTLSRHLDYENGLKEADEEDVFDIEEKPVIPPKKYNETPKKNDDELNLDLSILSDVSSEKNGKIESVHEESPKEVEKDEDLGIAFSAIDSQQIVTEEFIQSSPVKKKRPTPPPRYTKMKKTEDAEESSDWDNEELKDKENNLEMVSPKESKKTEDSSDWDTSIASDSLSHKIEEKEDQPVEVKQRLFIKKSESDTSKRSPIIPRVEGNALVKIVSAKDVVRNETFIPLYKDLTDSESDWSEDEQKNDETEIKVNSKMTTDDVKSEVDSKKLSNGADQNLIHETPIEEKPSIDPLKEENLKIEEKTNKKTIKNGEDTDTSDWDDSLDDEELKNLKKETPEGTLGREDTLHGIDEIWEKNPIVELMNSLSDESSIDDNKLKKKDSEYTSSRFIGKGNVAHKKNLFESNTEEIIKKEMSPTRGKVAVDVEALENILQNHLAEQHRRLNQSNQTYREILGQRRHSVDVTFPTINAKSYKTLLQQHKSLDRPKSSDSNKSEPIKMGNGDIFKAEPVMAEISSDEEVEKNIWKKRRSRFTASLGKFPTLKKLSKKLSLSFEKEKKGVEEKEDFVDEVLERLEIRRKSSPLLFESGKELKKTPSLDIVSESCDSSIGQPEDIVEFDFKMAENPKEKTEEVTADSCGVSTIKIKDTNQLVNLQDFIRELRLSLEREKGEREMLSDQVQSVSCERNQLETQLEKLRKDYCCMREKNSELESKLKSNEWDLQQSECRWKECDQKLKKLLTYVNSKEESLINESSRRQQSEMGNQSLMAELCVVKETLSVLHNECKQLQKEFLSHQNTPVDSGPSSPSWATQEIRNKEMTALRNQLDEANHLCQQVMSEKQIVQTQLNAQKMETNEWKLQVEKLQCTLQSEREKMQREVQKAQDGQKVEETALKEATLGYMVRVNNLECENKSLRSRLDESAHRVACLESEVSSHIQESTNYRSETCLLRRTLEETQKNFTASQDEQINLRKRLEVDLELVKKENEELKEKIKKLQATESAKSPDLSSPRLSRRAMNEMEQLRNQITLLHNEMSVMKTQMLTPHVQTVTNSSSGPFAPTPPRNSKSKSEEKARIREKLAYYNQPGIFDHHPNTSSNDDDQDEWQQEISNLFKEKEVIEESYKEIEKKLKETEEKLFLAEENFSVSQDKVISLETALVTAQDIIDKVNDEKIQLMETRPEDFAAQQELNELQILVSNLEMEIKDLRIQSEEAKMHSHKLQDELLRVRLDYKRSEESLMDEANKKREMLQELETYQQDRRRLMQEIEVVKNEKEEIFKKFEKEMEEQKRLWQIEARGRAELALKLLDNEHKLRSPGGDSVKITRKEEQLERNRNIKSVDLSQKEISKQIEDLEEQVYELKNFLSDKEEMKKSKMGLPSFKKKLLLLEQERDELREELFRFQNYVRQNYIGSKELEELKADVEARANHEIQKKVMQMRAHFDQKVKQTEKLNNQVEMSCNLHISKNELSDVRTALKESESKVELLQQELTHFQELYMSEVNLRSKMTKSDKFLDVCHVPFTIHNNPIKYLKESNQRLKRRSNLSKPSEQSPDASDMIYKVRAALDKSIQRHVLNEKWDK